MSKFFCLTKNPIKKIRRKACRIKISIKLVNIVIIGLVIFSSAAYLIQVNSLATKGYQIRELEIKISQLEKEGSALELEALNLQSIDNIKSKVSHLNMVDIDKVEYLVSTPVAFAR